MASQPTQDVALWFCLNTLGGGFNVEAVRHMKNGANDGGVTIRFQHALDKRAVDFDAAQRVTLEEAKRRIAGPKVVEAGMCPDRVEVRVP
ncbi:hypothetical protein AWB74_08196 [Caballeronia arvi]|uniref:Uncharacterized protein n=1 Tax=Caballeronia arvi TaxID=1777135 RepID=A0A158L316_9BURK|nr:hypothetical protein AWB74_08196 [Caballeronia arvi]